MIVMLGNQSEKELKEIRALMNEEKEVNNGKRK